MKTLNVNGKNQKVNCHFLFEENTNVNIKLDNKKGLHGFGSINQYQSSIMINEVLYKNCFTGQISISEKTGRYSTTYTCNKTGLKFGDSEKKCIEHLIKILNIPI